MVRFLGAGPRICWVPIALVGIDMTKLNSGIYKILNTQNGHFYIGSTVNFDSRWRRHKDSLMKNKHTNSHLQRAWNMYGKKSFVFEVVRICPLNKGILMFFEQHYLDKFWDNNSLCYNVLRFAHSALGYRHSDTTRKIMSEIQKGNKKNLGHKRSEATRKNLSDIANNMTVSHKEKIAKAKIGKPRSEETKAKIALALKGRGPSKEALAKGLETKRKKNLPSPLRGRKASEETRKRISDSLKGHLGCVHTEETKQKLREAANRQWANKRTTNEVNNVDPLH